MIWHLDPLRFPSKLIVISISSKSFSSLDMDRLMHLHESPFAKIILFQEDIAEVLINGGVEMNLDMVHQYHECLLTHLKAPFSLLINKINTYSYDFDAQTNIGTLPEIKAMAVVTYNRVTRIASESLVCIPREGE